MRKPIVNCDSRLTYNVFYAQAEFGDEEKRAVLASLGNAWLASGPVVRQFEAQVAMRFGAEHALAVNSGSSANLLAVRSLELPHTSEVITPACTFATTVAPLVQCGLRPVFIDSMLGSYTVDLDAVRAAITSDTTALMIPQLIGSINDMAALRNIAEQHNLRLINDCCDTFAPSFDGLPVSRYANITTTSTYGSHIITAMGTGGLVLTDDRALRSLAESLRDWGRAGDDSEDFDERFAYSVDGVPYDKKFAYLHFGYNLKMNEASAAFGLEQLKRLDGFVARRAEVFAAIHQLFSRYEEVFHLPAMLDRASGPWLAFPLTIRKEAPFTRYDLLKFLESRGIQTRVLFSGNIVRHPASRGIDYRVAGSLERADHIMGGGFVLGCHQGIDECAIDLISDAVDAFFGRMSRK